MQTAIRWAVYILGIEILFLVALKFHHLSLLPAFVATCVLLAANPKGTFAHPRSVLIGYMLVGHLGLITFVFWGNNLFGLLAMTLVVVAIMASVSSVHPPAIALLFQLVKSAHPFQDYLFMVVFVVAILGVHYAAQWIQKQLFPAIQSKPFVVTESQTAPYPTYLAAAEQE
ncbi:HPP family protein [Spirosoma gilvum]